MIVFINYILIVTVGVDYNEGPYKVLFPAGMTTVEQNITIFDDCQNETNKQFQFEMDFPSYNIQINTSNRTVTIDIIDDDEYSE